MPLDQLLGQEPIRIVVDGQSRWLFADGSSLLAIAGGDGTSDTPPAGKTDQPAAGDAGKGDDESFDKERALATIKKLRENEKAAKDVAKELADLKAEKAERERKEQADAEAQAKARGEFEKLAEAEKARAEKALADLTAEREARKADRVRHDVLVTAQRLGAVDPDVTYRLLDLSQVEYGDDGAPKNTEALLKALLKDKPYLVVKEGGQNGSTVPATPNADGGKALSQQELDDHRKRTERSYALRF